jgi:hypothetical protein
MASSHRSVDFFGVLQKARQRITDFGQDQHLVMTMPIHPEKINSALTIPTDAPRVYENLNDDAEYRERQEYITELHLRIHDFYILKSGKVVRNYYAVIGYRYNHDVRPELILQECQNLRQIANPDALAPYQQKNLSPAQRSQLTDLISMAHRIQSAIISAERTLTDMRIRLGYDISIKDALNYCPDIPEESVNLSSIVKDKIRQIKETRTTREIIDILFFFINLNIQFEVELLTADQTPVIKIVTSAELIRLSQEVQVIMQSINEQRYENAMQNITKISSLFGIDVSLLNVLTAHKPDLDIDMGWVNNKPLFKIRAWQFPSDLFI